MESAALLWEDQEMITPTQKNDDVMQACPSDMIFLHELGLTENEGGAPTCTNDLNPPLAEKDPSVRDLLYMLSDKSSFENGNFQQDVGKYGQKRLTSAETPTRLSNSPRVSFIYCIVIVVFTNHGMKPSFSQSLRYEPGLLRRRVATPIGSFGANLVWPLPVAFKTSKIGGLQER